jgi:hypothetical protein
MNVGVVDTARAPDGFRKRGAARASTHYEKNFTATARTEKKMAIDVALADYRLQYTADHYAQASYPAAAYTVATCEAIVGGVSVDTLVLMVVSLTSSIVPSLPARATCTTARRKQLEDCNKSPNLSKQG